MKFSMMFRHIALLPDDHSNTVVLPCVWISIHWSPSVHVSDLKCSYSSELDMIDKIGRLGDQLFFWLLVFIVIFLTAWVKKVCSYFAYLPSPGVIQMVEGGQVTADRLLCSLQETSAEEVRTNSIIKV